MEHKKCLKPPTSHFGWGMMGTPWDTTKKIMENFPATWLTQGWVANKPEPSKPSNIGSPRDVGKSRDLRAIHGHNWKLG
jgi:hypothetical protein